MQHLNANCGEQGASGPSPLKQIQAHGSRFFLSRAIGKTAHPITLSATDQQPSVHQRLQSQQCRPNNGKFRQQEPIRKCACLRTLFDLSYVFEADGATTYAPPIEIFFTLSQKQFPQARWQSIHSWNHLAKNCLWLFLCHLQYCERSETHAWTPATDCSLRWPMDQTRWRSKKANLEFVNWKLDVTSRAPTTFFILFIL